MANELESPSFSFSIEDTMEMGLGNQSLLNDVLSPETVTAKEDDIKKIESIEKVDKKKEKVPEEKNKLKEKEDLKEKETENLDPIEDFLSDKNEEKDKEDIKSEEEKGKKKEDEESKEEEQHTNLFNAFSKDLFKLGVFVKDEDEEGDVEINSPEEFLERFNYEKQKGANEIIERFIGQFGADYQDAFESIFVKGVNPKEYFGAFNAIQDFASLDLKIEANQIAVVRQALLDRGYEAEEIKAEIERVKNYGDLEAVAQRDHKALVKKEALRLEQLKKDSETKIQQAAAIKNQYVKNVNTILQDKITKKEFDGIPINPKLAQELQDFLITEKYKTPSGETLTEFDKTILELKRAENHEKKVKLALLLKVLEKDPTLSTLQKTAITKRTNSLFGETIKHAEKTTKKAPEKEKPSSWFV